MLPQLIILSSLLELTIITRICRFLTLLKFLDHCTSLQILFYIQHNFLSLHGIHFLEDMEMTVSSNVFGVFSTSAYSLICEREKTVFTECSCYKYERKNYVVSAFFSATKSTS